MIAVTPAQSSDLEFDNGTFDASAFAAQALANWQALAAVIDHTLLDPSATGARVQKLCEAAKHYRFASVVVNPAWVAKAVKYLSGTDITVGAVVGFPLGAGLASTLRQEAGAVVRLGAREMEVVIPIGLLKSGSFAVVQRTILSVANVAHQHGAILNAIIQTALLNTEERLHVAEIAILAGADSIQTSTGFATDVTSSAEVALLRGVAGGRCGVKALSKSGTLAEVKALLEAGANRIVMSDPVAVLRELGAE